MTENEIFEKWLLIKWVYDETNYIYAREPVWGVGSYFDTQEEAKNAMMAEIDRHPHLSACNIVEYGSFYGILYVETTEEGVYGFYLIECCSDEVSQMQVECENYRNEIAMLRSVIDAKNKQINYRDNCVKKQRDMLKKYKDRLNALPTMKQTIKVIEHLNDELAKENSELRKENEELQKVLAQRDRMLEEIRNIGYPF